MTKPETTNPPMVVGLDRKVMVRLTDSEIKTLIGLLKMMDATSDDRDPDYINFGILKRKFLNATGKE